MTIFTRIIQGEIPCYKIAENAHCFAFLDIRPLTAGHTLVIPKREEDYIYNLTDEETIELHLFAKQVAVALGQAVPCRRVGSCVMGMEVPHAHIHLVPLQSEGDLNFSRPKLELSSDEMEQIAASIRAKLVQ